MAGLGPTGPGRLAALGAAMISAPPAEQAGEGSRINGASSPRRLDDSAIQAMNGAGATIKDSLSRSARHGMTLDPFLERGVAMSPDVIAELAPTGVLRAGIN